MSKRTQPGGDRRDVPGRARVARVLQREDIGELERVFELYCELWELVGELPRRAAVLFVLDELAYSGVSEELAETLGELRALPFVESAAGPAGDRDSTWFGLQIMLNQLLLRGRPLLSTARSPASCSPGPRSRPGLLSGLSRQKEGIARVTALGRRGDGEVNDRR